MILNEPTLDNILIQAAKRNRRSSNFALIWIDFFVVFFTTQTLSSVIMALLFTSNQLNDNSVLLANPDPSCASLAISFGGLIIGVFIWVRFIEGRSICGLGLKGARSFIRYFSGFGIGFIMIGVVIILPLLFGVAHVDTSHLLTHGMVAMPGVLTMLVGWIIQGAGEEIVIRGWIMPKLILKLGVIPGVIISSILFSLLHIMNPGATILAFANLFLVGSLLALTVVYQESILWACGWHAAWNFTQSNLFGCLVSGMGRRDGSIIGVRIDGQLWGGSTFGPEGGLLVTFCLIMGIIPVLWLISKKYSLKMWPTSQQTKKHPTNVQ